MAQLIDQVRSKHLCAIEILAAIGRERRDHRGEHHSERSSAG